MKETITCKCSNCETVMNVRPLVDGVENPVPLVELEIKGNRKIYLDEETVKDLYIKALNALNVQCVPDEVAENYDK